ncbi:HesA/MoeB/ThiF family protein [Paraburkholderia caribensis]|uniref:HesA/MoeB/ThiF family protein n=1 Tax=Paraburkholderia caribensis TaxID=75105 RepID=UPI00159290EB|nr:ThiF family adenylyltransferase [Paraburkholderia caribensis]
MPKLNLRFTGAQFDEVYGHLYPGDDDEHGAVLLAGLARVGDELRLMVREVHIARDGVDYVRKNGHYALKASFIRPLIHRARTRRLVYLAVHNHMSSDQVGFSGVDFHSHEEGYPALLDLAAGMPVGALVFGTNSIEADLWMPDMQRHALHQALVVGNTVRRIYPRPPREEGFDAEQFHRQILMFGKAGQARLRRMKVAVIGLGGIGSLVTEYLARLGVGHFTLVDHDIVESTNLSRLVGATDDDISVKSYKLDIAERHIRETNKLASVEKLAGDVAAPSIVERLKEMDYIFLAADTMRARLVVNGLTQQYFVPAVQLGAKVVVNPDTGELEDAMSVVRPMRPGCGCLHCSGLINQKKLTLEFLGNQERKDANYGAEEPNPSVITLNAVSASLAANDFLLDMLELRADTSLTYRHISHINRQRAAISVPRFDGSCSECGTADDGSRLAMGDAIDVLAFDQFELTQPTSQPPVPPGWRARLRSIWTAVFH